MIVPAVELMKKKERKILLPSVANIRFYSQLDLCKLHKLNIGKL